MSRGGVTTLVTTHYLDEAEHCHRIAIMNAGKLAAMGTSRELKAIFAQTADSRNPFEPAGRCHASARRESRASKKPRVFGTAVHAVLKTPDVDLEALKRSLGARGLDIAGIDRVMPSLEDVFLDVVEHA